MESTKRAAEQEDLAKQQSQQSESKTVSDATPAATWPSDGTTEKSIDESTAKPTRPKIAVTVSRPRREFEKPYKPSDKDANDGYNECASRPNPNRDVVRAQMHVGVQATRSKKDAFAQTKWNRQQGATTQYDHQTLREAEINRIVASGIFERFLGKSSGEVVDVMQQNETLDIYSNDYLMLGSETALTAVKADAELREHQSLTDMRSNKTFSIVDVSWVPGIRGVVASSEVSKNDDETQDDPESRVLIWSLSNASQPEAELESPFPVQCFSFAPTRQPIAIGGLQNGQIALWDTTSILTQIRSRRQQGQPEPQSAGKTEKHADMMAVAPLQLSSIEHSHHRPVSDLVWLPKGRECHSDTTFHPSKPEFEDLSTQVATVSTDGQVLIWDTRYRQSRSVSVLLTWSPIVRITFNQSGAGKELALLRVLHQSSEHGEQGLFVTTEEGALIQGTLGRDMSEADPTDEIGAPRQASRRSQGSIVSTLSAHHGPCLGIARSPFFPDVLLTCGDWQCHVWREGCDRPLVSSPASSGALTSCQWSPTRPAVFIIGRADGFVEVWDLLYRSHELTLIQSLGSGMSAITCLEFQEDRRRTLLAVGNKMGSLLVMELPASFSQPAPSEHKYMEAFVEREVRRARYSAMREEVRAIERTEAEKEARRQQVEAERLAVAEAEAEMQAAAGGGPGTIANQALANAIAARTDGQSGGSGIQKSGNMIMAAMHMANGMGKNDDDDSKSEKMYQRMADQCRRELGLNETD